MERKGSDGFVLISSASVILGNVSYVKSYST